MKINLWLNQVTVFLLTARMEQTPVLRLPSFFPCQGANEKLYLLFSASHSSSCSDFNFFRLSALLFFPVSLHKAAAQTSSECAFPVPLSWAVMGSRFFSFCRTTPQNAFTISGYYFKGAVHQNVAGFQYDFGRPDFCWHSLVAPSLHRMAVGMPFRQY